MAGNSTIFVLLLICATGFASEAKQTEGTGHRRIIRANSAPEYYEQAQYYTKECRKCFISLITFIVWYTDTRQHEPSINYAYIKCNISSNQVENFEGDFQKMIAGEALPSVAKLPVTADECQHALRNLRHISKRLIDLNGEMRKAQEVTPTQYSKWGNSFDEITSEMKSEMQILYQRADAEARSYVGKAQDEINQELEKAKASLDRFRKSKDEQWLEDLIVLDIKDGQLSEAMQRFDELTNKLKPEIVRRAFDIGDVDKIVLFIENIGKGTKRNETTRVVLLEALVSKILEADKDSPMVLVIDQYIKKLIKYDPQQGYHEKLQKMRSKMQESVIGALKTIGQQVVTQNDKGGIEFAHKRNGIIRPYIAEPTNSDISFLKISWEYAVKSGEMESGASNILDFLEYTYDNATHSFTELGKSGAALYSLMEQNCTTTLSSVLRIVKWDSINLLWSSALRNLTSIQAILNGQPINLTLHRTTKCTFVGSMCEIDQIPSSEGDSQWIFVTDDAKTFYIKSHPTQYYLYASKDSFGDSERKVRGERITDKFNVNLPEGKWELRDAGWRNNAFLLWNKEHGEYLNVGEPGSEASVFTWRKDGLGPRPIWTIKSNFDDPGRYLE